jgi:hypothetical protein
MNARSPRPQPWELLRRLRTVGCPVDWEHLAKYPLRVRTLATKLPTGIFALLQDTGIVLRIQIAALAPLTIAQFHIEAGWLPRPVSWLKICAQHPGSYCFHLKESRPMQFQPGIVINHRTGMAGAMKRGSYMCGFLLGTVPGAVSPVTGDEAAGDATLWIEDVFGDRYPFPIRIDRSSPDEWLRSMTDDAAQAIKGQM